MSDLHEERARRVLRAVYTGLSEPEIIGKMAEALAQVERETRDGVIEECANTALIVATFYCGPDCPDHQDVSPNTHEAGAKDCEKAIRALSAEHGKGDK